LNGYEDVKPRLLEMKALSQEGLGMVCPFSRRGLISKPSQSHADKTPRTYDFPLPALSIHDNADSHLRTDLLHILSKGQCGNDLCTGALCVFIREWHAASQYLGFHVLGTCSRGSLGVLHRAKACWQLLYRRTVFDVSLGRVSD
jgi:hypothetical protein